jgi:hypothetical protein
MEGAVVVYDVLGGGVQPRRAGGQPAPHAPERNMRLTGEGEILRSNIRDVVTIWQR